jgi:prephenate dehydrogenase
MWRDILLANRRNLLRDLGEFERRLAALRGWLEAGDAARVERFLAEARQLRSNWDNGRAGVSQE